MFKLTWSNIPLRWAASQLGFLVFLVVARLTNGSCPSDLSTTAHTCFTTYNIQFTSIVRSRHKLCCGVDVETLRRFCRAYMDGMSCVSKLRRSCPTDRHHVINNALVNLDGATDGLNDLCSDDTIIEKYAMHQSCLTSAAPRSETCFRSRLEQLQGSGGTNIRVLTKVDTDDMEEFCRKMKATVSCVQKNVRRMCGPVAATLAAILVKPMVRHSTECDYTAVDVAHTRQDSQQPVQGNPAYISDDHSALANNNGVGSGSNSARGGSRSSNTRKREGSDRHNVATRPLGSSVISALVVTLLCLYRGLGLVQV